MNDLPRFFRTKDVTASTSEEATQDVPNNTETDKQESLNQQNISEVKEDPYQLIGVGKIDSKVHTIVKSPRKKKSPLKASLVGLKDGVPGTYSGFERVIKVDSKDGDKLSRTRSISAPVVGTDSPKRPPRRSRQKSASGAGQSESDYDVLWAHSKDNQIANAQLGEGPYSALNDEQERVYDLVEEDDATVLIEAADGKDDGWVETGVRIYENTTGNSPTRPQSTVVLPLMSGDEQESDSDSWATEFDDTASNADEIDDSTIYEVIGNQSSALGASVVRKTEYEDLSALRQKLGYGVSGDDTKPPLPPRSSSELSLSDIEDPDKMTYVAVNLQGTDNPPPVLPPLPADATIVEVQRYQIIKCLIESESTYMATLHKIFQEYEQPLKEKSIISKDRIKIIFHFIHEIEQCHQLFNMALAGRMGEWVTNPNVGDIVYASFSKSTVLKAYSNFARNFTRAMDNVKETCKLVPAFLYFLKNRLYRSHRKQTLYDLLRQPLERLPQFIIILQELLKVTPFPHSDHMSLQMAITKLECLAETVAEKRRDIGSRHKVQQLDKYLTGLNKALFTRKRYYIRHDDMLLCIVSDGQVVTTKLRRLFMLNDLLICAKILNRTKQLATLGSKRYKVKWCVPLVDVEVIDVGSGISVSSKSKTTTTIKYTHPVTASPRPGAKDSKKRIEDLQHDLTVIGEIAGLVASLRGQYEVLNGAKVNDWYQQVREACDLEIEMANMNWLELSLPARDGRISNLFNLSTPRRKLEWTAELDNAKLRLAYNNNPGWYLPDEEGISSGGTAALRRTLPLLSCTVPLFMVEQKYTIECILEVTNPHPAKPVLWIFSGNDHAGQVTLMEMSMSSVPHVVESFCACNSRILTAELVREHKEHFNDPHNDEVTIWFGTMAGSIEVYDATVNGDRKKLHSTKLKDSVVSLRHVGSRVFAGLADGTVACFRKKTDGSWDIQNPTLVILGQQALLGLAVAKGRLWCSCGPNILVLDVETLGIETTIKRNESNKSVIKHLVSYGIGVWASTWKSSELELFHAETYECLQTINVAMAVAGMKTVVDSDVQNLPTDKLYITTLLAHDGILWVGTDAGIILTYPLPRLGGVPQVSARPCVAFHGHSGPVRCLRSFRVTRNLKHRDIEDGKHVARSLFYSNVYDEVDAEETDLDTISVITRGTNLTTKSSSDSTSISGEPFYFTVEPDGVKGKSRPQAEANDEYKRWVSSFGTLPNPVEPCNRTNIVGQDAVGYHSDESMDSDTEFCFIEDRKNARKNQQVNKSSTYFSVNIDKSSAENVASPGKVVTKTAVGGLPVVKENEFAEIMSQFQGFSGISSTPTDSKEPTSSTPQSESEKAAKSRTFPVARASEREEECFHDLRRVTTSDDLYEQPVDDYDVVESDTQSKTLPVGGLSPSLVSQDEESTAVLDVSKHYRYAPLPPPPSERDENVETPERQVTRSDGEELTDAMDDLTEPKSVVKTEDECAGSCETPNITMDEIHSDIILQESNGENAQAGELTSNTGNEKLPDLSDSTNSEIQVSETCAIVNHEGKMKEKPISELSEDLDVDGISKKNGSGKGTISAEKNKRTPKPRPSPLKGAVSGNNNEDEEEIYTPLLPEKTSTKRVDVSTTSTLSGAGIEAYDREMALSTSLVRNSPEGYYATLMAGAPGESRSKRELLLQPWYVVSVGPGHNDFRRRAQPRGSARDFFRSFRNTDPEPQLLVWKITSG